MCGQPVLSTFTSEILIFYTTLVEHSHLGLGDNCGLPFYSPTFSLLDNKWSLFSFASRDFSSPHNGATLQKHMTHYY